MISLPLQVFAFVRSPEPNMVARGFGTAAVLLLLVLTLFALARVLGGRGPGQLSVRQQRAVVARSGRDAMRLTVAASRRDKALALAGASPASFSSLTSAPVPKETLS